MIERFLILLLTKTFYGLKKKYPNGLIQDLALVETNKLSEQVRGLLDELTEEEAVKEVVDKGKAELEQVIEFLKQKMLKK